MSHLWAALDKEQAEDTEKMCNVISSVALQ